MLNRLFKYNYSIIFIILFIVMIKVVSLFTGQTDSGGYSYSLFNIFSQNSFFEALLSAICTVLLGIFILFNSEHIAKRTDFSYLLVFIFGLQMSFFSFFSLTVEHIGLFFFILSLFFVSKNAADFNRSASIVDSFNLGFSLSIGTLFTPHLIYTLPLFLFCSLALKNISIKIFIAMILGYILPFIIIDTIIFAFFTDIAEYTHRFIIRQLTTDNFITLIKFNRLEQLSIIGPLFFLIYSIYITLANAITMKTLTRKFSSISLIMLIYIGITILLGIIPAHYGIMLLSVPATYFYCCFQVSASSAWQKTFFWIFLFSIALSFPPVINGIVSLYEMIF